MNTYIEWITSIWFNNDNQVNCTMNNLYNFVNIYEHQKKGLRGQPSYKKREEDGQHYYSGHSLNGVQKYKYLRTLCTNIYVIKENDSPLQSAWLSLHVWHE